MTDEPMNAYLVPGCSGFAPNVSSSLFLRSVTSLRYHHGSSAKSRPEPSCSPLQNSAWCTACIWVVSTNACSVDKWMNEYPMHLGPPSPAYSPPPHPPPNRGHWDRVAERLHSWNFEGTWSPTGHSIKREVGAAIGIIGGRNCPPFFFNF